MKRCVKCRVLKARDQFHCKVTATDGLQSRCKECVRAYSSEVMSDGRTRRAHSLRRCYLRDPQKKIQAQVEKTRRKKRTLVDERGGRCERCGYDKAYAALQFHHRDRTTKDFEIATKYSSYGLERLRREIAKCDLLCANCHAEEHAAEFQPIMDATGEYIA